MAALSYQPVPEPVVTGRHEGQNLMVFGFYRVDLDGFTGLLPHSGFEGTVSAEPLDLHAEDVREQLIATAREMRNSTRGPAEIQHGPCNCGLPRYELSGRHAPDCPYIQPR